MVTIKQNDARRKRAFIEGVINWGKKHLRDFRWRNADCPYQVLIAEFLLKRTTSKAAEREYKRFLEKFSDIKSLLVATEHEIEVVLKPIGLYRQRSKGLKKAAQYITEHFGGLIPSNYEDLVKVPHIGPYIAGATISFGFGKPAPIVDSNVRRVVGRVFGDILGDKPSDRQLRIFMEGLIPKRNHKIFNWGLIDLGYLICSYNFMKHDLCPLRKICHYYSEKHT